MHEHFREVSVQDKDANYLRILKRIGCHSQGFPERELPHFRKEASIFRTETFGLYQSNSDTICGCMTSSEVETHARRLGTEDTETHIEGLRSSADAQENSLHHSPCLKTQIQTRPTKNSLLQQKLPWRCTRPQFFQHGSFSWCQNTGATSRTSDATHRPPWAYRWRFTNCQQPC